jgi:hypothetical protein
MNKNGINKIKNTKYLQAWHYNFAVFKGPPN